jgi:hypothetical protein
MEKKLYKVYSGEEIFKLDDDCKEPLIDQILWKEDYVLLVAEEKMGKTILAQQMACALSSGTPFLDIFNVPKAVRVWYFATEGRANDLKDRFMRMRNGVSVEPKNLCLIPTFFRFNTKEGTESLTDLIQAYKHEPPQVIIIDALYRAVKGSIKNDDVVNDFHAVVGSIQHYFGCAVVLVHHMTKPQRAQDGSMHERTDKDSFGSAFLSAAVDHIIWIERFKKTDGDSDDCKKDKIMRCDTQRSGVVFDSVRLRLLEPDPLLFTVPSKYEEEEHRIVTILSNTKEGCNIDNIIKRTKIGRSTIYTVLKRLIDLDRVTKLGNQYKGVTYKIKGNT